MPRISIALATFNGSKYLREQIDSILNQSIPDFELIVCDDGSSDNTMDILWEYSQKDKRVQILQNKTNLGFKKNFEYIISHCNEEFIAFCDQDDIWTTDHLEVLLNNIGDSDCICGNALMVDGKGISLNITMKDFIPIHITPQTNDELFVHEIYGNVVQGAASMIRRNLCTSSLPIPDVVKYHDWWFALNACVNNGCKYTDQIVLKYRRHEANVTSCPKFGIKKAISFLFESPKEQINSYSEIIELLNEISKKKITSEQEKQVNTAKRFYQGLLLKNDKIWTIGHYISKYNQIQLSHKRNFGPFFYRLFCLVFKNVKL